MKSSMLIVDTFLRFRSWVLCLVLVLTLLLTTCVILGKALQFSRPVLSLKWSEWMSGWMGEWVDGWMDRWMSTWMDEWVCGTKDGWMDRQLSTWMHEWMNGWVQRWVDAWTDGWVCENTCQTDWEEEGGEPVAVQTLSLYPTPADLPFSWPLSLLLLCFKSSLR